MHWFQAGENGSNFPTIMSFCRSFETSISILNILKHCHLMKVNVENFLLDCFYQESFKRFTVAAKFNFHLLNENIVEFSILRGRRTQELFLKPILASLLLWIALLLLCVNIHILMSAILLGGGRYCCKSLNIDFYHWSNIISSDNFQSKQTKQNQLSASNKMDIIGNIWC